MCNMYAKIVSLSSLWETKYFSMSIVKCDTNLTKCGGFIIVLQKRDNAMLYKCFGINQL